MKLTTARWISLSCAAIFCIYAVMLLPSSRAFGAIIYMLFPLAAIWYGDELGNFSSGWRLNTTTPGIMIKIMGWILLLLTPLCIYTSKLRLEFFH